MQKVKKFAFTLITLILIPLIFFVLLELGLKLFGVGVSYNYFNEIEIDGIAYYQENPDFADQFYPASLNIGPLQNTFSQEQGDELVRVYVLGGSAAMGFPHKNHGFDRLLETQLRAAMPTKKVEVINTAMTSVNSHVMYDTARNIPDGSGDFAIILMGNNEVVGPYGPGTFNQNFLSNLTLIRSLQALKRTRLWQAFSGLIQGIQPVDAQKEIEWEGMTMFTKNPVTESDPRMDSVYSHFENNLKDMIEELNDKGMHVILSNVPVNYRQSAPFLSVNSADLSTEQLTKFKQLHSDGLDSMDLQNWDIAISSLKEALAIDSGYADSHFQIATAYEKLMQYDKAKTHYHRALDLDALRFRADSHLNQIITEVADSVDGAAFSFVDNAAAFEKASSPYQAGWNLLLEHVHYDFPGNYLLSVEFSNELARLSGINNFKPLPDSEVAARVGFPNLESNQFMARLKSMVQQPPFIGQSNHADLLAFMDEKIRTTGKAVGSPRDSVARRQSVVAAKTGDWKLHFELASIYIFMKDYESAYKHFDRLFELYPHNGESYIKIADILSQESKWSEVIPYLMQSLNYTRGNEKRIAETTGWLGTAYFKVGQYDKATETLLGMVNDFPEEVGLVLRAYGNLIKNSRDEGMYSHTEQYVSDIQDYAESLIAEGKDKDFPVLYRRMEQVMNMAGKKALANKWKDKGTAKR